MQTLDQTKEDVKLMFIRAENTLTEGLHKLEVDIHAGEQRIESITHDEKQRLESRIHDGEHRIERKAEELEQRFEGMTQDGEQRIKISTNDGEERIDKKAEKVEHRLEIITQDGEQRICISTNAGEQRIESKEVEVEQYLELRTQDGEQRIKISTREGEQRIESKEEEATQCLERRTQDGEKRITSMTNDGEHQLESKAEKVEQRLELRTQDGEQRITSKTHEGEQRLESKAEEVEQRLERRRQYGEQSIKINANDGEHRIESKAEEIEERIERRTQDGEQRITSKTNDGEHHIETKAEEVEQRLEHRTHDGEQRITSRTNDGEQRIERNTQEGERRIDNKTWVGERRIDNKVYHGEQRLDKKIHDVEQRLEQSKHTNAPEDYERGVAELIQCIKNYYNSKLSHVTISALNDAVDELLRDMYMPPKICLMCKEKGTYKKTEKQVTKYKDMFSKDDPVNTRIFLQGEAGSGKTTFATKLALDWCLNKSCKLSPPKSSSQFDYTSRMFDDLNVLQDFMFVFHIRLRNSFELSNVTEMIKKQIINNIHTKEDRKKAYALLNEIMKRERCLIILDGLDEWTGSGGHHNLPTLVENHSRCILLITTRPWKLAEGKVKHSDICRLFQLEGINDHFKLSRIILSCLVDKEELDERQAAFENYIRGLKIGALVSSPMMFSVIVCSFVEGTKLKGSMCEIYSIVLDSLLKKASSKRKYFQKPQFKCFTETQYLQPNIDNVIDIAEAAFCLLFSDTQEHSIVFGAKEIDAFLDDTQTEFALKAGILTETKTLFAVRSTSTFSFIHKSVQEFFAAYHIACNENVIYDVISENLKRRPYLDIHLVFVFLCGLKISAANALSQLMEECALAAIRKKKLGDYCGLRHQDTVCDGYIEAVANMQTDINLRHSHLSFVFLFDSIKNPVLQNIWNMNAPNALSLTVTSFLRASEESKSSILIDLSSCHKLDTLKLYGQYIEFKDTGSSAKADVHVWITLKSSDRAQYEYSTQLLPCIKYIKFSRLTCSPLLLRGLFSVLLTLDHEVQFDLENPYITPYAENAANLSNARVGMRMFGQPTDMALLNNTLKILLVGNYSPGLWVSLCGLNIKSLSLCRNIKSLSLCRWSGDLEVKYVSFLSHSLSSLTQLETLSIKASVHNPGLWKALRGLNIKCLSLDGGRGGFKEEDVDSISQSLSTLTKLETLSIKVDIDSPSLWKALHGLKSKGLSLGGSTTEGLILTRCLSESIRGINIKSLSSRGYYGSLIVKHASLLSQTISSLKYLDSLTVHLHTYIDIKLPPTLKCLNFYCDALLPSELRELVNKLFASTQALEGNLAFNCASSSFDGLYLKRIQPEDYIAFYQELENRKQVAVKRFQIYDRTTHLNKWIDFADSAWSERANKGVVDDDHGDDSVDDDAYNFYLQSISREIINRISLRIQVIPAMVK
ncbi:uncharacterized protein LOC127848371 [Dreissena polymorpha]|nr:uncharacterized protein LOC127848371 [Dreissena polymorpha]